MPNRILKESVCTSDNIDNLTWFEEVFFYRLIVNVDDYGRMDARPKILSSKLFPLKNISEKVVCETLCKLCANDLITVYEVGGKHYLQMNTWEDHQRIRAKVSKYPKLTEDANRCHMSATCGQMHDNRQSDAAICVRNPIQSESNPNPNNIMHQTDQEKKPVQHKYGMYDNVLLSDEELEKLKSEFPSSWQDLIERLSSYMASTGKHYKSHLATMRNWASRDNGQGGQTKPAKTVSAQQYDQRNYSSDELASLDYDIIADARKAEV